MYYQMRPIYPNEIMHSGVKGQKWGQRRYQNPDGTLTAAVATAITLPTTGRVVVAVPFKRGVLAGYANKMERQQGIKSPYIGSPKALKRDKR